MIVDLQGMKQCITEANALSNKPNWTKGDERRNAFLLAAISAIKEGATLRDLELEDKNEIRQRYGIKTVSSATLTPAQEQRAKEFRTMLGGDPAARIGTYTGLGYFVPTGWTDRLYATLGEYDALFSEDACTVLRTPNGQPLPIPTLGDISNEAVIVSENSPRTPTDVASTGQALLGTYTFDSLPIHVSMEAETDMVGALSLANWAESVFASRLARGIGRVLINGTGSGQPLGILNALENANVTPVTAAGSAANTGDNTQTGANSIGLADLANLVGAVDTAYLASSKAAFLMNRHTLAFLNGLTSKMGTNVGIVQYVNGEPTILGLPVKVSPTMPGISASSTPILCGDFSYWLTRLVNADQNIGLMRYVETSNLIEHGVVGIAAFTRASGALLWTDNGSPSPIIPLRMHS